MGNFTKVVACAVAMSASMSAAIISFNSNGTGPNQGNADGVWATGFSTGNTVLTGGAVDPHYTLIKLPAGCTATTNGTCQESGGTVQNPLTDPFGPATYVVLGGAGTPPGPGYPIQPGAWNLGNDAASGGAGSSWIGPRAGQSQPTVGGTYPNVEIFASGTDFYAYRMVFNLTALGLNPGTANIQLAWLSDNADSATNPLLTSQIRLCAINSASDPVCGAGSMVGGSGNGGQGANALTPVSIIHGQNGASFSSGLLALDFIVYNSTIPATQLNPSGMRVDIISATADNVPEPGTMALLGFGLAAVAFARRKR